MKLTERDSEILAALSCSIRLMSLDQIANHWWSKCRNPTVAANRRLAALCQLGFLAKVQVLTRKLPTIVAPIATWFPGMTEPDLGAIAWQLESRWQSPLNAVTAFLATAQAAKYFGGKATGRIKAQYQATHDLGVAEMFLRVRQTRAELVRNWIGEDRLAPYRKQQKLPDAIIANSVTATPQLVLEFGGAYNKERVTEFHRDCEQRACPYEIW